MYHLKEIEGIWGLDKIWVGSPLDEDLGVVFDNISLRLIVRYNLQEGVQVDQSPNNPLRNKLGPGVNETNLVRAIQSSGYPLQGVVTDRLKADFSVIEEWGYIDRDAKEHRSLDIFASKALSGEERVHPSVALLIECKRSVNPYVFFKNLIDREIPAFPRIGGWTSNPYLRERSGNRVLQVSGTQMFGLTELPFIRPGPPHCSAFGMATLNGDKVSMSGSDPYNSLILPLTKAMDHAASRFTAGPNPSALYPTVILSVAVIDAPILIVSDPREATPLLTPWVRVPRQEARTEHAGTSSVWYVLDIVHSDFFDAFVSLHLDPFVNEFAQRVCAQTSVLFLGGVVENLDKWCWNEIKTQSQ